MNFSFIVVHSVGFVYFARVMTANVLANFRKHLKISQKEFARALGVSHAVVANLESDRTPCTADILGDLIEPLTIDAWDVYDGFYADKYDQDQFYSDLSRLLTSDRLAERMKDAETILDTGRRMIHTTKGPAEQRALLRGMKIAAQALLTAVGQEEMNQFLETERAASSKISATIGELNGLFDGLDLEGAPEKSTEAFLTLNRQIQPQRIVTTIYTLTVINGSSVSIHDNVDVTDEALKRFA
jgi:transcriptional regulator with XRE-family HTH domain